MTPDGLMMTSSGARQKRIRTSFKHDQLRTLKSYFAMNRNPDAKDLKVMSQKTQLSKRVLQVRCRRCVWRCFEAHDWCNCSEILHYLTVCTCGSGTGTYMVCICTLIVIIYAYCYM